MSSPSVEQRDADDRTTVIRVGSNKHPLRKGMPVALYREPSKRFLSWGLLVSLVFDLKPLSAIMNHNLLCNLRQRAAFPPPWCVTLIETKQCSSATILRGFPQVCWFLHVICKCSAMLIQTESLSPNYKLLSFISHQPTLDSAPWFTWTSSAHYICWQYLECRRAHVSVQTYVVRIEASQV